MPHPDTTHSSRSRTDPPCSGGNLLLSLLLFALAAWIAVVLLLGAVVAWLTVVSGSFVIPAALIGIGCALIALLLYRLALREALHRLHERAETLCHMARITRDGYDWVVGLLQKTGASWLCRPHRPNPE